MLELLRQYVSGYVALTNEEFAFLANMLVIRNFDKRQPLLQIGEVENYMNFVVKGLARMYFCRGKTEVITNIAKEGELLSSSASFLSGTPSYYIVETLEPTTFLSLSRQHLDKLYRESPRIERLGRLMTTHFVLQKEEWELECMRLDTRERFLHFVESNPELMERVPQKYLASYLNMKPETFSRLKHLLKKRPSPAHSKNEEGKNSGRHA
ncbi:MAG TPA: Crp/Fnr family transcriptional regulator [Puia sp.]|jgi:CRP-like cAMP-binding protein|nr:Crp/Fnr family transcriptional regulator [Puia sp.]